MLSSTCIYKVSFLYYEDSPLCPTCQLNHFSTSLLCRAHSESAYGFFLMSGFRPISQKIKTVPKIHKCIFETVLIFILARLNVLRGKPLYPLSRQSFYSPKSGPCIIHSQQNSLQTLVATFAPKGCYGLAKIYCHNACNMSLSRIKTGFSNCFKVLCKHFQNKKTPLTVWDFPDHQGRS